MPKAYSEAGRMKIKKTLLNEAKQCLKQYGFRKTTVDDLVRRAGIPKGTFYLFYKSKEQLLNEAYLSLCRELETEFIHLLARYPHSTAEELTKGILTLCRQKQASFLLYFMAEEEKQDGLPGGKNPNGYHMQTKMSSALQNSLAFMTEKEQVMALSCFKALLLLMAQKEALGNNYNTVIQKITYGLVLQFIAARDRPQTTYYEKNTGIS